MSDVVIHYAFSKLTKRYGPISCFNVSILLISLTNILLEVSPASRLVGDLKVSCQPVTGILIRKWRLHGIVTLSYNLLYFNI